MFTTRLLAVCGLFPKVLYNLSIGRYMKCMGLMVTNSLFVFTILSMLVSYVVNA